MCGIVGYTGDAPCVDYLMGGLRRLEYRGYDSAGVAVFDQGKLVVEKAKGHLDALAQKLQGVTLTGTVGIGHTRWATHGEPSYVNSHPHLDSHEKIAIVHNGIIENYYQLKQMLQAKGVVFRSETDTEVVVQLLGYYYEGNMLETLFRVMKLIEGSFALAIICKDDPDTLYCTRKDSPLVVGKNERASFIASDIPAMLAHTRDIYLLDDYDVAVLTPGKITFYDALGTQIEKQATHIDWDVSSAEKGGYAHFMIKEIHEQPAVLRDTMARYLDAERYQMRGEGLPFDAAQAKAIARMGIIACGTAYHAGLVGKSLFERLWRVPVEVSIASEFRYSDPIIRPGDVYIIISQSGETADTIAAMRLVKKQGATVIAICNVVGSTIAREADHVLYTLAGPEIAVASTKAYSTQLMMLYILALDIAKKRGQIEEDAFRHYIDELAAVPGKVQQLLDEKSDIQRFASETFDCQHVFFLGRGLDYALAMEAALKLKEISYIHSEAYAAGELKHGTIALVERGVLVVGISTQQHLVEKMASNLQEVSVRGAEVLALVNGACEAIEHQANAFWRMPASDSLVMPMICIVPMQLFAYYMALQKGCDIDKPRNLAKSVTVE
nr:glutamine--fructose-6-phosphate transaminase (isomerizing) [Maliibacterium massiliense]